MSADKELFQPPTAYPAPPKDMYYDVPSRQAPSRPKPIFPWEENQAPPTRVFPDEVPMPEPGSKPRPQPIAVHSPAPSGDEFSVSPPQASVIGGSEQVLSPNRTWDEPMTPFSPSQMSFADYRGSNAWDDDVAINKYVGALQNRRKGGVEVMASRAPNSDLLSPTGDGTSERRQSMKITEFPTEIERPSLPVTPAPIRRNMFWGSERDAAGNLPEAEGVIGQTDWDPEQQLEKLRRNSLLFAEEPNKPSAEAPLRNLPESSRTIVTSPQKEVADDIGFSEASEDPRATSRETTNKHSVFSGEASGEHLFGSDGTTSATTIAANNGPGVVWVDHNTAGSTFEQVSSTSQVTHSYTTQSTVQSSSTAEASNTASTSALHSVNFDPPSTETQ